MSSVNPPNFPMPEGFDTNRPFPSGAVIPLSVDSLSEDEKKKLAMLGLEGEKEIPGNLADAVAERLKQIQEELAQEPEYVQKMAAAGYKLDYKIQDLEDMPEDVRSRLGAALKEDVRAFREGLEEARNPGPALPPNVAQAAAMADKAVREETIKKQQADFSQGGVQLKAGSQEDIDNIFQRFNERQQQQEATVQPASSEPPKTEPKEEPKEDRSGLHAKEHTCRQCGWHSSDPPLDQPNEKDKENFILSTVTGVPFAKQVVILGGKMMLTFCEMTMEDQKSLAHFIDKDLKKNPEYTVYGGVLVARHIASMQIAAIQRAKPGGGTEVVDIAALRRSPEYLTKNAVTGERKFLHDKFLDDFENKYLVKPTLVEIIRLESVRFSKILRTLEDRAYASDFWNPTTAT